MDTAYDRVAYPTVVHQPLHPDRLAVAARLAGLDPAPIATARMLDIGGGTCLSLTAYAAQYPQARAHGFDLAESAVARGSELAGPECANVEIVVEDILKARERYAAGSFDYVVAHGVYAWVPGPVREELLRLVAHVLSDRGVAFVSYNALPGGHVRMILREMVLHAVAGITEPEERVATAYAFLKSYSEHDEDGESDALKAGLRKHAASMAARPASVLFHDEMGDCYAPQSLTDVVSAAQRAGLAWLTDAGRNRGFDGFLTPEMGDPADPTAAVLYAAQARDYLKLAFFRASLFVKAGTAFDRHLDPARIDGLWVSTAIKPLGGGEFASGEDRFAIADAAFAQRLADLAAAWPERRPVSAIALDDEQRRAMMNLYREWYVGFHLGPAPFALIPGERPCTAPWVRGMLARGEEHIVSLAWRTMRIDQPALRALLVAADGTRTLAELETGDHGMPRDEVAGAIAAAGKLALMVA